ncbi:MAG: PadR family transcriptional regulator [Acidimicrobiia bacterium]|nr:PadR family transcriptional regulator [Acidimicrobiia bacterium]
MRRTGGDALVTNEIKVLRAALEMLWGGQHEFHGYELASTLADLESSDRLMNQSTLYRGLRRLEERGALESHWEDPDEAAEDGREGRPRRYYRVTADGVALAKSELARLQSAPTEWWRRWKPAGA